MAKGGTHTGDYVQSVTLFHKPEDPRKWQSRFVYHGGGAEYVKCRPSRKMADMLCTIALRTFANRCAAEQRVLQLSGTIRQIPL
jgi:hypothetical protein